MSTEKLSSGFKDLLNSLPYPVAIIISKYLRISAEKISEKHSVLCDIFEAYIKLISIITIKDAFVNDKKIQQRFPNKLDFLEHPSLGHWVSIIREFGSDTFDDDDSWLSMLSKWYKGEKPNSYILSLYNNLHEITFPKGISAVAGIIDSLVTYRNKVWKGHGAVLSEREIQNRLPGLEALLLYLLNETTFLQQVYLFYTQEVKKTDDNSFQAICISLNGTDLSSVVYNYKEFDVREIYLVRSRKEVIDHKPLTLSPLLEWQARETGDYQIYYFNDAKRTKLEYLSYFDGSFYYHKEIKEELSKIFNVHLQKTEESDQIIFNYSEEERKDISDHFYQEGLELAEKKNWEGAIVKFEDAIEWWRRPEIIVAMCKCMLSLNDDKDYVLNILEYAFEMDPECKPAIKLKKSIEAGEFKIDESEIRTNYFEVLLPDRIREFPLLLYTAVFTLVFGSSAIGLFFLDEKNMFVHIFSASACIIISMIMFMGLASAKNKYIDSYYPLLRQQANMRMERFKDWYDKKYKLLFGDFIVTHKTQKNFFSKWIFWSLRPNYVNEKFFIILAFLFVSIFSFNAINIQQLFKYDILVAIIRFLETFMIWLIMTPVLRFIITSTLVIKEYSNLELKPVVSLSRNNGFSFLNNLFISTLLTFDLFWIFLWAWNLIVAKDPLYFDFIGLGFGLIISLFWVIYTPLYINRALNLSKSLAVSDYDNHINKAFEKFVKNPDNTTYERLEWLKNHEKSMTKISTKLFGFMQWFIYVLSFFIIIGITVLYIMIRLNLFPFFSIEMLK